MFTSNKILPTVFLLLAFFGASCRSIIPFSALDYERSEVEQKNGEVVSQKKAKLGFDTAWFDGARKVKVTLDEMGRPTMVEYESNLNTDNAAQTEQRRLEQVENTWMRGFNFGNQAVAAAGQFAQGYFRLPTSPAGGANLGQPQIIGPPPQSQPSLPIFVNPAATDR